MHLLNIALVVADQQLRDELRASLTPLRVRVVLDEACLAPAQLRRFMPDMIFLESGAGSEPLDGAINKVKSLCPGALVAVVSRTAEAERILEAMRAGAEEFFFPPFGDRVLAVIDRLRSIALARQVGQRPTGKVLGIVSAKGGCGATTVACHLASELQCVTTEEILLADFDLEVGMTGFLLNAKSSYSILDALKNLHRLDASFWKGIVHNVRPRLDIIPTTGGLSIGDPIEPQYFSDMFRLLRSMYGWIVLDLGRGLSFTTLLLLSELDELFVVSTPNIPALYQAKLAHQRLSEAGMPQERQHLVLNQMQREGGVRSDEVARSMGVPVYAELADRPEVDEAYTDRRLAARNSPLGKQLTALAMKIAGLPQQEAPVRSILFPWRRPVPAEYGA